MITQGKQKIQSIPGSLKVKYWDSRKDKQGQEVDTYIGTFDYFRSKDGGIVPTSEDSMRAFPAGTKREDAIANFLDAPVIFYDFKFRDYLGVPIEEEMTYEQFKEGFRVHMLQHPDGILKAGQTWREHEWAGPLIQEWRSQIEAQDFTSAEHIEKVAELVAGWWIEPRHGTSGDGMIDLMMTLTNRYKPGMDQPSKAFENIKALVIERKASLDLSTDYGPEYPLSEAIAECGLSVPNKTSMWINPLKITFSLGYRGERQTLYQAPIELT